MKYVLTYSGLYLKCNDKFTTNPAHAKKFNGWYQASAYNLLYAIRSDTILTIKEYNG